MLQSRYRATWRSLNLALFAIVFCLFIFGTYWNIQNSISEQRFQATQIRNFIDEALELHKGNLKPLKKLLTALPGSPMFSRLELLEHGKTLQQITFDDSPSSTSWLSGLPLPPTILTPLELPVNNKGLIKLFPAQGFFIKRLESVMPILLTTTAFIFFSVNFIFWLLKKRFGFILSTPNRWNSVIAEDQGLNNADTKAPPPAGNILDCLPDAILRCNESGLITYTNILARDWLPLNQALSGPVNILDLIAPWDRTRCTDLFASCHIPGNRIQFDTQAIGTRRGAVPVTIYLTPAPDNSGDVILVLRNATTNKTLQDKLNLLDLVLTNLPLGIAVLSQRGNGELLYCNNVFSQTLQISDAINNDRWFQNIIRYAPAHIEEEIRNAILNSSKTVIEFPWQAVNQAPIILQLQLFPSTQGETRLVCVLRNNTEEATYRQRLERELAIRRVILDEMPLGLCITNTRSKINVVNAAFAKLTDSDPRQLIGSSVANWLPNLATQENLFQKEHNFQVKNGNRFIRLNSLPLTTADQSKEYAYFFEDITAFKQKTSADGIALDRLQRTLDSITEGIITTNEHGFIQYMNPYARKLTGLDEHQYKGVSFAQAIPLIDEKKREPLVDPAIRALRIGKTVKFRQDVLYVTEDKQDLAVEISASPVWDNSKALIGAVVVMKDVAEQRTLSQQMQLRASRDPLTGLVNRRELVTLLEGLQYEVEEQDKRHTLCYMDLDKFKIVNDVCGHNAGDELLRQVSTLMNDCLRTSDMLARIGGDEFCAVLSNTSVENAVLVAEKIREAVKRFRFTWNDKFFEIGVSIGLFGLRSGLSVEETINSADQACYQAKEEGRDCIYITSTSKTDTEKPALAPWSERLAEALDHDYFRLFRLDAQPLNLDNNIPEYHEILLQLHEPNQIPLISSAFMPNAQRLNLTASIERWVIGKLFSTISSWALDYSSKDVFAIQLSASTLAESSFVSFLSEQSRRHGVMTRHICFEIAEDDLVQNFSTVQNFMQEGKKMGYGFCLSRFGGGISSFAYLRNLPLDFLKIDSSLTYRLTSDPIDAVIVRAILSIGDRMQIRVIAQNVSNQAVKELLTSLGIDYTQGSNKEILPLETSYILNNSNANPVTNN